MRISVIIPCYNEAQSIAQVVRSIPKEIHEIIVVDNNSTDDTARIAAACGARVVHEPKRGYGKALKTGFSHATGDVIVTIDGDGQYPTQMIVPLAQRLDERGLDFVSGNRLAFPENGAMPPLRAVGNRLLSFFTNALFGLSLVDSQSGMWAFKRAILEDLAPLLSDDMPFSEEIKIKAAKHPKLNFGEYPIPYLPRIGTSKLLPFKHGAMNLLFLPRLFLSLRRHEFTRK